MGVRNARNFPVTVNEGSDAKGGAGIFVGPVGIGTQAGVSESESTISRIKFQIAVFYPYQAEY